MNLLWLFILGMNKILKWLFPGVCVMDWCVVIAAKLCSIWRNIDSSVKALNGRIFLVWS